MPKREIGLVIQGILTSKANNKSNENCDWNINIKKLLDNYSHLFSEIVLVTWKEEEEKVNKELLNYKNLKFLFLEDPGIPEIYSGSKTSGGRSDNRLRQFYSSYEGFKALSDQIDIAIKTRTDLYIDVEKIIKFFLVEEERKKKLLKSKFEGIICSKRFHLNRPYWLSDFLYIGNKNILIDFFFCQIKYKKERFAYFEGSPEGDSVLKFLFYKRKEIKIFRESKYFPALPKRLDGSWSGCVYYKSEFDLWQFSLRQFFSVLPYEITKPALWRGEDSYKDHIGKIYRYEDFLDAEKNYVETLNKIPNATNSFILLNYDLRFINFNYLKRKFEKTLKGKYSIFNIFRYLNKLDYYHRRILFIILKKYKKFKN